MASSTSEATKDPISLRESFQHALPFYAYNPQIDGTHNAKDSGQHTSATSAPKFAILRKDEKRRWATIGKTCLDEIETKTQEIIETLEEKDVNKAGQLVNDPDARNQLNEAVELAKSFLQDRYYVPEREGNIEQLNEADVVRCATLYLVHPVAQTFWLHPTYSKSIVSRSEDTKDWARTDLTFYKTNKSFTNRAFMVLEYKRRTVIKKSQFEHRYAMPRSWKGEADFDSLNRLILTPFGDADHSKAIHALEEVVKYNKTTMNNPGASAQNLFASGGSLALIKQASAYAIEHSTRYVALFNYDFLVLCYFPWLDHEKQGGLQETRDHYTRRDVQYPVEVEIFSAQDSQLRLALLGFMRTAWEETPFI